MTYEFLVLHALENLSSATPDQITKWLQRFFCFSDGKCTRVALKRLRDKGLAVKDESGFFSITSQGRQFYESKKNEIFNGELSLTEQRILNLLYDELERWEQTGVYDLKELAKALNLSFKKCFIACVKLACKKKIYMDKFRKHYWIRLRR
jgi:hypothetical protein